MSKQPQRVLDTAAKEALLLRHASGETLGRLARETGILRKSLYEWRDAYRCFGVAGLNRKRGPKPGGKADGEKPPARPVSGAPPGPDGAPDTGRAGDRVTVQAGGPDELAQARAKIAELERMIGRQQVDLDFFQQALRLTDAAETKIPTAPASMRSSTI